MLLNKPKLMPSATSKDIALVLNARPSKLDKDIDILSAFKQVALECIAKLQANQNVVLHSKNVEGVRKMRVALRRLRSAFSLFDKILEHKETAVFLKELKWLAGTLGKARDLDVFITQTLPTITTQFKRHAGLQKLKDKALNAQIMAYKEVCVALSSQRYQHFLLNITLWLDKECGHKNIHHSRHVELLDFATAMLDKLHKKLRRNGKHLSQLRQEELHDTRISIKKLRYTAEFFCNLYPSANSVQFINDLSQLQDQLGILNDITTNEKLLLQLIGSSSDESLDEALFIILGQNASNAISTTERMGNTWHAYISQKPFWRK
jgi:triphosphatase